MNQPLTHPESAPGRETCTPVQKQGADLLAGATCSAVGLAILAVAEWDYVLVKQYEFLRVECLVAGIAAGIGATFCFGGALYFFNRATAQPMSRFWRVLLGIKKRVLVVGQILAMVIAVGAACLWILGKPVPVGDQPSLHPFWEPPTTDTPR